MNDLEFINADGEKVLTSFENVVKMKMDRFERLKINILAICFRDSTGQLMNELISDPAERDCVWKAYQEWVNSRSRIPSAEDLPVPE